MSIQHIDHITYVAAAEDEHNFITRWGLLGFKEYVRVHTPRYPAAHIALASGDDPNFPWAMMTGLSVSDDPKSPINLFVQRYGAGPQHVAYNIGPGEDMEELHRKLVAAGWRFMTGVLTYRDNTGAGIRQMFVAPQVPYGPFSELVQRIHGPSGQPFDGFDTTNIDNLYEAYVDYSAHLERQKSTLRVGAPNLLGNRTLSFE
ncbi:hypothetical protein POL68_18015 [Stigmatella sp. ncwal1]|uniref:VOC domain-containing protein n=1 Tax=Stigmatella ashevillensis TaxID=2995309 RepID=A0ABT5D9M7_9BACT|nr:hypothetical protein [Stigmatella ashevillena]MDC0710378.1 hypothetical protein [Stigmatella ashevillena]